MESIQCCSDQKSTYELLLHITGAFGFVFGVVFCLFFFLRVRTKDMAFIFHILFFLLGSYSGVASIEVVAKFTDYRFRDRLIY